MKMRHQCVSWVIRKRKKNHNILVCASQYHNPTSENTSEKLFFETPLTIKKPTVSPIQLVS
jgi:propanediol utilization protein